MKKLLMIISVLGLITIPLALSSRNVIDIITGNDDDSHVKEEEKRINDEIKSIDNTNKEAIDSAVKMKSLEAQENILSSSQFNYQIYGLKDTGWGKYLDGRDIFALRNNVGGCCFITEVNGKCYKSYLTGLNDKTKIFAFTNETLSISNLVLVPLVKDPISGSFIVSATYNSSSLACMNPIPFVPPSSMKENIDDIEACAKKLGENLNASGVAGNNYADILSYTRVHSPITVTTISRVLRKQLSKFKIGQYMNSDFLLSLNFQQPKLDHF